MCGVHIKFKALYSSCVLASSKQHKHFLITLILFGMNARVRTSFMMGCAWYSALVEYICSRGTYCLRKFLHFIAMLYIIFTFSMYKVYTYMLCETLMYMYKNKYTILVCKK